MSARDPSVMGSGRGQNPSRRSARPIQQEDHTQARGKEASVAECCDFCLSGQPEVGATLWKGLPWGPPRPSPSPPPCSQGGVTAPTGSIPLYGMPALHCTPARAISQGKEGLLLLIPLKAARAAHVPELHPGSSPGLRPRPFCLSCVLTTQPSCLCSNPPSSLP